MLLPLLLSVSDPAAAAMNTARDITAAESRCPDQKDTTDVTVCGRRRADRFRVPFIVHDPGDRQHEPVSAERTRLLNRTTPLKDLSPFLVGGGMAGVTVGVGQSGGASVRKPAP